MQFNVSVSMSTILVIICSLSTTLKNHSFFKWQILPFHESVGIAHFLSRYVGLSILSNIPVSLLILVECNGPNSLDHVEHIFHIWFVFIAINNNDKQELQSRKHSLRIIDLQVKLDNGWPSLSLPLMLLRCNWKQGTLYVVVSLI